MNKRARAWRLLAVSLLAFGAAAPVRAAYPGVNGKIAFESERAGEPDIWVMNGDGSNPVNLTADLDGYSHTPSFSADGRRIVFVFNGKLATMNADGSDRRITGVNASVYSGPIFTPDGAQIIYEQQIGTGPDDLMIVAADGSGTPQTLPAGGPPTSSETSPAISPDGNQLAFSSNRGVNYDLYLGSGTGSGAVNFSNRPTFDLGADFSPDGSKLIWTNSVGSVSTALIAPVATIPASPTPLPLAGLGPYANPVFSPDGTRIAFGSRAEGGDLDVLTAGADGQNVIDVSEVGVSNVVDDSQPSWAPLTDAGRELSLVYKKRKHRFKGQLTAVDPGCVAGASVKVLRKHKKHIRSVARATTDGAGAFSAVNKRKRTGRFYATVNAEARVNVANCLEASSAKLKVR